MPSFTCNILDAFRKLYTNDIYLLESNSTEASLQFRIAIYLATDLENEELKIDCEYNTFNTNNTITPKECPNTDHAKIDIIYHKRGTSDKNIFAIELKKKSAYNNKEKISIDKSRIKHLVSERMYNYREGYAIYNISINEFFVYHVKKDQHETLIEGEFIVDASNFEITHI